MAYRRWILTRNALLSGQTGRADPEAGGFRVPDGFGGTRRNYFSTRIARPALTTFPLAGRQLGLAPVGGLVTFPNPDAATVVLTAWWAYSEYVTITRVHPDGERVLVRRGAPRATGGETRVNRSFNPRFALDVAGVAPGPNTAPPQRITEGQFPAGTDAAVRLVALADGRVAGTLPVLLTGSGGTVSFIVRTPPETSGLYPSDNLFPSPNLYPSLARAVRVRIAWGDGAGVSIGETVHEMPTDLAARSVETWDVRFSLMASPLPGAQLGVATLEVDGVTAGETVEFTAVLDEAGRTARPYFDGDQSGGNWAGGRHSSPSTLAPTVMVVDGECPLDTDVFYEMTNPRLPGFRISTAPVRIATRATWMTDPLDPENPFQVTFVDVDPIADWPLEVAEFSVPGRRLSVTIAEETRHVGGGSFTLTTRSEGEHDRLRRVLRDPSPKLIRMPADHRHGPGEWWRIKAATPKNLTHHVKFPRRNIEGTFTVVTAPPISRATAA